MNIGFPRHPKYVFHLVWTLTSLTIIILIAWVYKQQIMSWLSVQGSTGVIRSVVVMTVFCIIPIPAEVVMIENIRAHGIWLGTGVNFVGAFLGAEILFCIARFIRLSFIHIPSLTTTYQLISREKNRARLIWLLLAARILPVPAKVVDISAGIVKSISWWDFTWTTAVGIIPYQLAMVFIYHGWRSHSFITFSGVLLTIMIGIVARIRSRRWRKLKSE